jgi:hypothetical protein
VDALLKNPAVVRCYVKGIVADSMAESVPEYHQFLVHAREIELYHALRDLDDVTLDNEKLYAMSI